MKIQRAYKTELAPNVAQTILCWKSCGTARFAWNWGLARRKAEYEATGKSSNAIEQHRQLNELKPTEFPWMYEVSKCAPQESFRDLDKSYKHFFRRVKEGGKSGFPKFKSKHNNKHSFRLTGSIHVESRRIKLPNIGWVKLKERDYIPQDAKILSATVSARAQRWFVSVLTEEVTPTTNLKGNVVGIDLGVAKLATTSDNVVFLNPKALKKNLKKLACLQRRMAKQVKGSKNKGKTRIKVQRLHYRVGCIRQDAIHQMTTAIAKTKPSVVVIEDLAVRNMLRNRRLARSIADAAFGEIRRQLAYKGEWTGFKLVVADRWFPSSKTCSRCGHIKVELKLSDRTFVCPVCGLVMDRDLNASINLREYYNTVSSTGINACGDECSRGSSRKQELKTMKKAVA